MEEILTFTEFESHVERIDSAEELYQPGGYAPISEIIKSHRALLSLVQKQRALLEIAKCPNCDGSGEIQVRTGERQYVTRDMAMDAGEPEMEGMLYSDEDFGVEQCRWCDERTQLFPTELKPTDLQE